MPQKTHKQRAKAIRETALDEGGYPRYRPDVLEQKIANALRQVEEETAARVRAEMEKAGKTKP